MGLFNFLKKKEKEKWVEIYSPLNGKVIDLEEVPDEAFYKKMIGDGCAIEPIEGAIYAPVDGEVRIFETNHVTSFKIVDGLEVIICFGVDAFFLNGEGFKRVVESREKVKKGEKLLEYNLEFIKSKIPSVKTPIVVNNMDMIKKLTLLQKEKK